MRKISVNIIRDIIRELSLEVAFSMGDDIRGLILEKRKTERSELGVDILDKLILNSEIALEKNIPTCQDTGMAVIFVEIGQEVHFTGGNLTDAINEGVRQGYKAGHLRKSVVEDPLRRVNSGDNTPAVIHYDIVPGDKVKVIFSAKGFGSENMSRSVMLRPTASVDDIISFVRETVEIAGPNACPPVFVGIGLGGTLDKAAVLAKKALTRNANDKNKDPYYAELEKKCLDSINNLGIGPQGLGGDTTALAVKIETFPTHIAGLPLVVNLNCHAVRHARREV